MAHEVLARFLAHSVEMESEARVCYLRLAEGAAAGGNQEVADFFARMAKESQLHLGEISELAEGLDLPELGDGERDWDGDVSPEAAASAGAPLDMSLREALLLALENERAARKFYASFAERGGDPETRRLAAQFAAEEASHAEQLVKKLAALKS